MQTYNELIDTLAALAPNGEHPETGVTLSLPIEAYAAYCYSLSLNPDEFGDWYSDAEDAYAGTYDSDSEFAQHRADDASLVPHDAPWPLYCIDWERAARDLMFDYFEHDHFYFRNE